MRVRECDAAPGSAAAPPGTPAAWSADAPRRARRPPTSPRPKATPPAPRCREPARNQPAADQLGVGFAVDIALHHDLVMQTSIHPHRQSGSRGSRQCSDDMRAAMRQDRDIAGLEPDFATIAGIQQTSANSYGITLPSRRSRRSVPRPTAHRTGRFAGLGCDNARRRAHSPDWTRRRCTAGP
jgi:hypothetical protein